MKWILCITWLMSIVLSLHAEEDSTSPPYGYNSPQQGGSRLYPSLTGVTDYNRNGYNNLPGQTGNSYNSGSRYPYPQPGNNQPYPVGTGPYNMSYSGYPSNINNMNYNNYNSSFPNGRPGQNNYGTGTQIRNPHQPFGNPKPIVNPHQPFGTPGTSVNNPYHNQQNTSSPYNPNYRPPVYPNNPNNPTYPNYPTNQVNHGNSGYGVNQSRYPSYPTNPVYPGNTGYHNNSSSYPRQPVTNTDPHRPFGQPPRAGGTQPKYNPYYKQ